MSITVEAIYENGAFKLDTPLPFAEKQRVTLIIQEQPASLAKRSYGLIGWTGDPEIVRKIALDPELGLAESLSD
jgi:predicted DNA-binding antitoxin AbrB/MazE fold protein